QLAAGAVADLGPQRNERVGCVPGKRQRIGATGSGRLGIRRTPAPDLVAAHTGDAQLRGEFQMVPELIPIHSKHPTRLRIHHYAPSALRRGIAHLLRLLPRRHETTKKPFHVLLRASFVSSCLRGCIGSWSDRSRSPSRIPNSTFPTAAPPDPESPPQRGPWTAAAAPLLLRR